MFESLRASRACRWSAAAALALGAPVLAAPAAQRAALPPVDHAVVNVALEPGESAERATLLLREGRIAELLPADADAPPGCIVIDGADLICLPAFVDGFATGLIETPEPTADQDAPLDVRGDVRIDMRLANRKGIQPAFEAHEALELSGEQLAPYRKAGFGYAVAAPSGELLAGRSSLVALRDAAVRDAVIEPGLASHAEFAASGGGYPSTLMGYHAQLRQFFSDARHHAALEKRQRAGRPGPRPALDPELSAGRELLDGELLIAAAEGAPAIRRWIRLSDELELRLGLAGGREAWRLADVLAKRETPLWLTLDWGDEVDDPRPDADKQDGDESDAEDSASESEPEADAGEDDQDEEDDDAVDPKFLYEEPFAVRLEQRLEWERDRDGALALHAEGVRFALGTGGESPSELLERVRTLIEAGLERDVALAALTETPARWAGIGDSVGRIAAGRAASLALWSADPLSDEDAELAWLFVEGYPWKPDPRGEGEDDEDEKDSAGLRARNELERAAGAEELR